MTAQVTINTDGRHIGLLADQLAQHGGQVAFLEWVDRPGGVQVQVHLPDDEARAAKCREIVADWNDLGSQTS